MSPDADALEAIPVAAGEEPRPRRRWGRGAAAAAAAKTADTTHGVGSADLAATADPVDGRGPSGVRAHDEGEHGFWEAAPPASLPQPAPAAAPAPLPGCAEGGGAAAERRQAAPPARRPQPAPAAAAPPPPGNGEGGDRAERRQALLEALLDAVRAAGSRGLALAALGQQREVVEAKRGVASSLRTFVEAHPEQLVLVEEGGPGKVLVALAGARAGAPAPAAPAGGQGRRQKRREAQQAAETGSFLWVVEVQNSATAHAGTGGACSVKIVAARGESEELVLNGGGGMKTGELVRVEARAARDLGPLEYVELKNTSAETWRPHWIKVRAPDGQAYAEVSGGVGLRALPGQAEQPGPRQRGQG